MRDFLRFMLLLGFVVGVIHIIHAVTLDRIVQYREITVKSPRLMQIDGYRAAFITDTHVISERVMEGIVDRLNIENLDILLLGGDYSIRQPGGLLSLLAGTVDRWASSYHIHLGMLASVHTRDGVFGVLGNHDNRDLIYNAKRDYGIILLENEGVRIADGLFLGGVEDKWRGNPSVLEASRDAYADDFIIMLSHNPDVSMSEEARDVDIMLSGHTHSGQINFFGVFAPYLLLGTITDYNQRFMSGFAYGEWDNLVYVSRGTGQYFPRVFSRPEVTLITFVGGYELSYSVAIDWLDVLFWVFILWNIIVFFVYVADKRKAQNRSYRISEKTLLSLAFTLGALGALLGVFGIRHKTRHRKFTIVIPILLIVQIILLALIV